MIKQNSIPLFKRCISVNASLSNISTTELTTTPLKVKESIEPTKILSPEAKQSVTQNLKSSTQVNNDMKDAKTKPVENNQEPQDSIQQPELAKTEKNKTPISKLSILAILLTACLGGAAYYYGQQQSQTIEKLNNELATLKSTLQQEVTQSVKYDVVNFVNKQNSQLSQLDDKVNSTLSEQVELQKSLTSQVNDSLRVAEQNIVSLNERLTAMSKADNNIWLISQANYLVNLAGRKIWSDQDYVTARLLLKNADASLAQANDPSLLPARQAIFSDINQLSKISFTDYDGIVMNLFGLADIITELPLVDHYTKIDLGMTNHDDSIVESLIEASKNPAEETTELTEQNTDEAITQEVAPDEESSRFNVPRSLAEVEELTGSISNWSTNLAKSSQSFFEKFVQVERYDSFGECIANAGKDVEQLEKCQVYKALITPEQALYLRENIRLRLFIAAQAVPRHQELIYNRALSDVATWVNAYFDSNAPTVKAFLDDLANLQQQSISNQGVPERLASQAELETLMQTRVRSMLAN